MYSCEGRDETGLEQHVDVINLILNNEPERVNHLAQRKPTAIIDLIYTTTEVGTLVT